MHLFSIFSKYKLTTKWKETTYLSLLHWSKLIILRIGECVFQLQFIFKKKMYQQLRVWGTSGLFVLCQKNSTTIPKNIYITQGTYYLRPQKTNVLAFKICLTKSVCLACSKIYLIKAIPSTKKRLYRKTHRANQILSKCYFSTSNAYACIEDPENQITNRVFNHNCQN